MKTGLRSSSSSSSNNSNNNNNSNGSNIDNPSSSFLTPPLTPQPVNPPEPWDMPVETKSQTSRKTRGAGATKSPCPKNTIKNTTLVQPGEPTTAKTDAF
ncbi:hypothetical protein BGX26_006893, partial [Mortierella sp. AD094]